MRTTSKSKGGSHRSEMVDVDNIAPTRATLNKMRTNTVFPFTKNASLILLFKDFGYNRNTFKSDKVVATNHCKPMI